MLLKLTISSSLEKNEERTIDCDIFTKPTTEKVKADLAKIGSFIDRIVRKNKRKHGAVRVDHRHPLQVFIKFSFV